MNGNDIIKTEEGGVLAVDIGASSGRCIYGAVSDGAFVTREIYRFKNAPLKGACGLVWDIDYLFHEVLAGFKRAKELGLCPASVGIDTWAVDYVLLDGGGARIAPVRSYRDPRTEEAIAAVHAAVPFEALYARTGIQFQPFNTIYRLFKDKTEGRLSAAHDFLMLPDYLNYLLTGKRVHEYTNATSTGLVNLNTRGWDRTLLIELGLPAELFSEPLPPGTALGPVKEEIAHAIGYRPAVVLPATHDTASAVIGAGTEGVYLSSGTWSLLGIEQDTPHTDAKSRASNFTNEGHLGGNVRFQKNIMGLWMIQQLRSEECPARSFAELAALAEKSQVSCRVDVNGERFLAPPRMKEAIEAEAGRALSVGEAAYCVFASLAKRYAQTVGEIGEITGVRPKTLRIFGGGCKNRLLNSLTAEATGLTVLTGPAEATVAGNHIMQLTAAGVPLEEAKRTVQSQGEQE